MSSRTNFPLGMFFVFSIGVLVLVVMFNIWNPPTVSTQSPQDLMGVLRPEPKQLASFNLVDQKGESFTRKNLLGKWTFLFFGYTSCPDVCPMTLSVLSSVYKELGKKEDRMTEEQMLFVSVDPARDTPEKLAEYMAFFNGRFIAATGEKSEIDNFSRQCGAGYMIDEEASPGEYLVNHTSAIFLIDPKGRLVASFSQPHNADTILMQYQKIRAYIR